MLAVVRKAKTRLAVAGAIVIVGAVVFRTFVQQSFVIVSTSMSDTLLPGDVIVANRLARSVRRGDVWIFDAPIEAGETMVKRIVGVPGDTLMMRDGMLYLNGARAEDRNIREVYGKDEKLSGSMWRSRSGAHGASRHNWGPIVIQDDSYFMLGDNRDQSRDSRYWGPVSDGRLMARVVFILYSYDSRITSSFPSVKHVRWKRIGKRVR